MRNISTILFLIFFQFISMSLLAQYQFNGKVFTEDSIALQGVTVSFQNKSVAITNAAGEYSFVNSVANGVINFSFIGYESFSGLVASDQIINIKLKPAAGMLDETIIKAYEGNTVLQNSTATVSVLNNAALERYGNTSFVAAVNTVPGVKMDERSPGSYRLSIRGNLLRSPFGVRNVKVYWNGIPFTDANGNTYLNQIGFGNIGSMEILKGPAGSMYGAGTGGVVLLSSPVGQSNENSISMNILGASYGTLSGEMAYKVNNQSTTTNLSYTHQQSDGWRNHTAMRRDVVNYTGSFILGTKRTINAHFFYSDLYYQTPGGLTKRQLDSAAKQSRQASGPFRSAATQQAAINNKTLYAGVAQQYRFNQQWTNTTSFYTSNSQFKNPSILNYQRKTEQGLGGRTVTQFKQGAFTMHVGGEYQYAFTATRTFGNRSGVSDTLQFDDEISATQYNIFLQTAIKLPHHFNITAGVSYNNYQYGFTRLNKLPATTIKKLFDPVVVPRIALLKNIGKNYTFYGSIGKGYSPPTIDEIVPSTGVFNTLLRAEKAINYELGARGTILPSKLYVSAAMYWLFLNNTIVTRRDAAGADYFVNAGNTHQRGLELSVNYFPLKNGNRVFREVQLWGNFSHINARFKNYQRGANNFSGNKLTGTPPNVLVLGADVIMNAGFYTNLTYSYTAALPLNDANTFTAADYHLLFLKAGYKKMLTSKIHGEIYVVFDQSFDNPYSLGNDLNAAGNRFFNPSAPQNFTGGIKIQFNLK